MRRVLLVDDDRDFAESYAKVVEEEGKEYGGIETRVASSFREALDLIRKNFFDIAFLDIKLPDGDGIQLADEIKKLSPDTLIVIMTAYPSLESAIKALRLSAYDYLVKPFSPEEFIHTLKKALDFCEIRDENRILKEQVERRYEFEDVKFVSSKMAKVMDIVKKVAPSDCDVLITGESGVGKELVARTIHKLSPRARKRFVAVNSSAIPEHLLESELFGYEKGAFTGATTSRQGLIEYANGGTLFLDEICDMPLQLQAKILRFLQERTIRRLGDNREIKVDVRVICATNKDIEKEVEEGRFREDLFWRINVIRIHIPPLRERPEDIPVLVNWYLKKFSRELGKSVEITKEAMEYLENYHWPGNVRELQNVIKRAILLCKDNRITPDDLPENIITHSQPKTSESSNFFFLRRRKIEEFERKYLTELLKKVKGDTSKAIKESGIPKTTFYRLLKKYNLNPADFE